MRSLQALVQFTKDDRRESPLIYDSYRHFEAALARPGLDSEEYRIAAARLEQTKSVIKQELEIHGAHAMVIPSGTGCIWSHAGHPQLTVPIGKTGDHAPVWKRSALDRDGVAVEVPLLNMHPGKYAPSMLLAPHGS